MGKPQKDINRRLFIANARAALTMADAFRSTATPLRERRDLGGMVASATNLAFALELLPQGLAHVRWQGAHRQAPAVGIVQNFA
jgi:hypothetical protein